jgi:hypothetical protein
MKGNTMTSDTLARILTIISLVVFAAGSSYVAFLVLGIGQGPPGPDDYNEVSGYAVLIILPLVLLAAGAFGMVALIRMRGLSVVPPLLVGLVVTYVVVRYALGMIVHVAGNDQALRHPGVASVSAVLLFLAVNIVAMYVARSYILSART